MLTCFLIKLCPVSEGSCPSSSLCVFWGYVFGILFLHWGATAYALATAYTLVMAHVGIRIRRSEITATATEGINAAPDTNTLARRMAMAAQAVILETQKASLSAQYAPASGQRNPLPQSGENR